MVEAAILENERDQSDERLRLELGLSDLRRARGQLQRKQEKTLDALGENGGSTALNARLADIESSMGELDERTESTEKEIRALRRAGIAAETLLEVLAEFNRLWETLVLEEQARVLDLLLESVVYDGSSGSVELTLRDLAPSSGAVAA